LNTAHYHILRLERDGEVTCWRDGGHLRVYPPWVKEVRTRKVYALLQQGAARKILRTMSRDAKPGRPLTNRLISDATGLSKSTVSEYLSLFLELQIAKRATPPDGGTTFELEEADRDRLLLIQRSMDKSLIQKATDSYLDLWEM